MNISGIRPSAGFYSFNNIQDIGGVFREEAVQAVDDKEEALLRKPQISQEEIDEARSRQTYGSADYAREYRADEMPRELKGEYSDLRTLDIEQAISDMQKDQMLSQYQYFVGEVAGMQQTATLRGAEDFQL